MILSLFFVLIAISLAFILVGLLKPDESAMAMVGFVFLFLLSVVLLNGNLQYETGANITNTLSYDSSGRVNGTIQSVTYSNNYFSDSTSHQVGYYMAIVSVVGFVGVLLGLRSAWKAEKERRGEE